MTESPVQKGDGKIGAAVTHGANISSQRMDSLDTAALFDALRWKGKRGVAIDLACGTGLQGLRFASIGFQTVLIDWIPIELTVLGCSGIERLLPLSYTRKDIRTLCDADLPDEIALCYSQRFIHHLRSEEARGLLCLLRGRMPTGAKLFLSASGLLSELGEGYAARAQPLEARFARLAKPMAEKHGIHESVCLYSEEDLVALCSDVGFRTEHAFSSPFGNVKGVFTAM